MPQKETWEKEYRDNKLVSLSDVPQKDFLNFLKFLRKKDLIVTKLNILDLGCGVGKNSIYLAKLDNTVVGIDISPEAIKLAKERAKKEGLAIDFRTGDIGSKYPFTDGYFDLIIDVISSNSLNEKEREIYLKETKRVLKTGGHLFVRTLCKDGDKNAKNLIAKSPGPEKNTYTIKELGLTERAFEEKEIKEIYSQYFSILKLEKKSAYTRYANQSYKRNYWVMILNK
jgi:SAM-dependent methyltransferase